MGAELLLRYLALSGFFITVALVYTGGLQGTGDTRSPLYITLASQIADSHRPVHGRFRLIRPLQSDRHLDGDRARPLHALRAERPALPPGQVAAHQGGD